MEGGGAHLGMEGGGAAVEGGGAHLAMEEPSENHFIGFDFSTQQVRQVCLGVTHTLSHGKYIS